MCTNVFHGTRNGWQMRLSGHSCSSVHGERLSFSTAHCTQLAAGSDRIIIIIKNEPVRPLNTIERCINNVITNNNNKSRRQSLNDLDSGVYRYNIILLLEFAKRLVHSGFRTPFLRLQNIEPGRVRTGDGGNNEQDRNLVSSPRDAIVSVPKGPPG